MEENSQCCDGRSGPGYASPAEAMAGPRETILYVTCVQPNGRQRQKADYLATVDVDPNSPTYCRVIGRAYGGEPGEEFHHMGWNSCSSCNERPECVRNKLILPCLNSDAIYVFDTSNERSPQLHRVISGQTVRATGAGAPHTSHCLANGNIMVSFMGSETGENRGSLALIDGGTFALKGRWSEDVTAFGYDFWYQPRHNVMVSSSWGAPNAFRTGLNMADVESGRYGTSLHFWQWNERRPMKTVDLGNDGLMPLEVRFAHDPNKDYGYVGCALGSTVFAFCQDGGQWNVEKVIAVPPKKVNNWIMAEMPAVITDILMSMDDRFLYFSDWFHGDVRQYDITDPKKPQLVGQIFVGGLFCADSPVTLESNEEQPVRPVVKGVPLRGGPQMLQLSLDGKRLYVTNSLYSAWDKQFYSDVFDKGSHMIQINVDTVAGGLTLNGEFLVDFANEPDGHVLAHEMRYPGGDCTSDIWK